MRDLLRSPLPPEVDTLYVAGISCDLPDGSQDGEILVISNSIKLCYGILNVHDIYVIDTEQGAVNPRAEIKRLPPLAVAQIRHHGHPKYVYVDPQDPGESKCVGTVRKPPVVLNLVRKARPRLRSVA